MDLALAGRTITIAGSTAGIGLALTTSLDQEHARLLLVGGRPERLNALARTLSPGALIGIVPGDLRKESDRNQCRVALRGSTELDGFVFLPAQLRTDAFSEVRSSEFRETFDVNVFAALSLRRPRCLGPLPQQASYSCPRSTLIGIPITHPQQAMTVRNVHWRASPSPSRSRPALGEYARTASSRASSGRP